jgi:DNA-binding NarL/FixJ family response regulator
VTPNPLLALLVEDDPSWQGILAEILDDYGLTVTLCENLAEALTAIHATPFRLAVIDLSLAGKDHHNRDGLQVLTALQRQAPGCASILLTGYASVELAVTAIQEYGAYTCLRKENFRRAEFRELIHEALAAAPPAEVDSSPEVNSAESEAKESPSLRLALIVEDDAGWRSLLSELVSEGGFQVQACASYGEAQGLLKRLRYQLVIADISLASSLEPDHNQDGYRLLNSVQQAQIPAIVVSGSADPDLIDRAFSEHGIFACFEKQAFERKSFLQTIRQASEQTTLAHNLTEREIEVLALLAQGLGNKEIAAQLFISTNTVKRHLKSIYARLGVNTRAAASAYAIRLGLEAPPGVEILGSATKSI